MQRRRNIRIVVLGVLLAVFLAYELIYSPLGHAFTAYEMPGKVCLLGICAIISFAVIWCAIHQGGMNRILNFSWKEKWSNLRERYHIEERQLLMLAIIVLIGVVIRFAGINWGIDSIYQPDETDLVSPAVEMAESLYPYHNNFEYPGQFLSKIAAALIAAYWEVSGVQSVVMCNFIFRGIVAFCGVLTIIFAYLIGNRIKNHIGLIFASLVAIYPEFVNLAKQVTGDVTGLLFTTLIILFGIEYSESGKKRFLFLMSMAAAMATLEKWHGAVSCFYIAFIVILQNRNIVKIMKYGFFAFISYCLWIVALVPNLIWNFRDVINGFIYIYSYDEGTTTYGALMRMYLRELFHYIGILFGIFFVLGFIYLVFRLGRKGLAVVAMGVFKLLAVCFLNRGYSRWGQEFYFAVLFVVALGIYYVMYELKGIRWRHVCGGVATGVIMLCFMMQSLLVMTVAVRSDQDTRYQQDRFCAEHGITRENSIYDYYTAFVPGGPKEKEVVGYSNWKKLEDSLEEESGYVYLREKGRKYGIDAIGVRDSRTTRFLPEYCPVIARWDVVCGDIFNNPVNDVEHSWLEAVMIYNTFGKIKEVMDGGFTGHDIVIYDITTLPYRRTEW